MCRSHIFSMQTYASRIAAAACIFVLAAGEAASQLAVDFPTAFERTPIADSNYGWAFSVTAPITIDGLGLWDAGSNGLVENHEVGLWRTFGNVGAPELIAQAPHAESLADAFFHFCAARVTRSGEVE